MNNNFHKLAIIIPTLDPSTVLIEYVEALIKEGFVNIFIVNDGSSSEYDDIFKKLHSFSECILLTHSENKGKGAALKTAYQYIIENFTTCQGIITADSDGQHAVKDVCEIANQFLKNPEGLILGTRNFSKKGIPIKSFLGNRISSVLFFLFHGSWVKDTQTGLRAFHTDLLPEMLSIPGDRFEYEMEVLTTFANKKIPIKSFSIDTIYIDDNTGTHFRPITDSLLITKVMFGKVYKFMLSSGLSTVIDISLSWFFFSWFKIFTENDFLRITLSVILARLISLTVNYTINKNHVFKFENKNDHSFRKYFILAVFNMVVTSLLVHFGYSIFFIDERISKLICDVILFVINYKIQKNWVFSHDKKGENT